MGVNFIGSAGACEKARQDGLQRFVQSVQGGTDETGVNSLFERAMNLGFTVSTIGEATKKLLEVRKAEVAAEGEMDSEQIKTMRVTREDVQSVIEALEHERREE